MRAVIYCRVSTKEQVQNLSLEIQERECRRWCQANGYAVDRVFVDAGESAKTADRPEFQQLLTHCRQNKKLLNAVVVHSLSRFSRNTLDHHTVRGLLLGYGITLRSVSEPTDDSPEGLLVEDLVASVANYENRAKARRTVEGMRTAMEAGRWTFVAPIGFLNSADRGGPSLIPDPERAHLVQLAFMEFGSGHLTRPEVLQRITALGLRTRKGGQLSPQTFHTLLRNPLYAGRIAVQSLSVDTVADFQPLVAPDLFDRVQRLLSGQLSLWLPTPGTIRTSRLDDL
jgi:Site-specific recombinases, DNA invertase Pin homologs